MSDTPAEHKSYSPESVRCAVITISDSRTAETDTAGKTILDLLVQAGHQVVDYQIVKDETSMIGSLIEKFTWNGNTDAILTTGGTGISPRDSTYEVISRFLDKRLDGFGELFRMLSYQEIGSAAMMSRALAGVSRRTVIIALPGSQAAVRLAMEKLVIPELAHMVGQVRRRGS